jgi:hypothetical protein
MEPDKGTEVSAEEKADRVPGNRAATQWRQAARRHQFTWRERHGWGPGEITTRHETRMSGNRVADRCVDGVACNFLNRHITHAVEHRLDHPQPHQTLDEYRLWHDLLSSMPMCFNLFGPLWNEPTLAAEAVARWFRDLAQPGAPVTVRFEWSPGRKDPAWLGDRTAFDCMIEIGTGPTRTIIGIETKYHEYPMATSHKKSPKVPPRYLAVSSKAGLFIDADQPRQIWGKKVEQVWRDHLLALACKQHDAGPANVRYVLVALAANPTWKPLVDEYRLMLQPGARATVEYRTIETLLEAADGVLPQAAEFEARYLDVDLA